jgi:glycosyltransferase involved in cell wall biosynthesis
MRPDIVHCHGAKGGVYGRLAAALVGKRSGRAVAAFYAPHGGSLHYNPRSLSGRVYFSIERALERLTAGLIHVSGFEARIYREKIGAPRCPAHVIRNGLRPEEFERVELIQDVADFLFIGELRDLKGVDVFIEALAILKREGLDLRALIVGPATSDEGRRYRAMANAAGLERHLSFRSTMPARRAFALARTVVLPSRAESMPYLVLEAAAAGVPLVVTDVGGIPEIFEGTAKRLVPPGSAEALAAVLRAARAAPEQMAAEAVLFRERLREKFSLEAMAARIEAVYRAALESRYRTMRAGAVAPAETPR